MGGPAPSEWLGTGMSWARGRRSGDPLDRSRITTVVCVALTSNQKWAQAPANPRLTKRDSGLPRDSVANVPQIIMLDTSRLHEHAGRLGTAKIELLLSGIDTVLGR